MPSRFMISAIASPSFTRFLPLPDGVAAAPPTRACAPLLMHQPRRRSAAPATPGAAMPAR